MRKVLGKAFTAGGRFDFILDSVCCQILSISEINLRIIILYFFADYEEMLGNNVKADLH